MTEEVRTRLESESKGRTDMAAYINRRMAEEGITIYCLAKHMKMPIGNLSNALKGKIGFRQPVLETILWILDGRESL